MKKSFLIVLALAGMSICSFAQADVDIDDVDEPSQSAQIKNKGGQQPKKTPEERAQVQAQKLKEKLGLSEEQKTKVYQLNLTKAKKMDELRVQAENERKAKKAQAKQIQEENDLALKNDILTPEQYTKYVQLKEMNEGKKGEPKGGRGNDGGHKKGRKK